MANRPYPFTDQHRTGQFPRLPSALKSRAPSQRTVTAAKHLAKARARKLITTLVGQPQSCPPPSSSSSSSGASGSRRGRRAPAAGVEAVKM